MTTDVAAMTPAEINAFIAERVHGKEYYQNVMDAYDLGRGPRYDPYHDPAQAMAALLEMWKHGWDCAPWLLHEGDPVRVEVWKFIDGRKKSGYASGQGAAPIISRAIVEAILEEDECLAEKK